MLAANWGQTKKEHVPVCIKAFFSNGIERSYYKKLIAPGIPEQLK
jgi:hypothetical protein